MGVEVIYIVRHGFRLNYTLDLKTGTYLPQGPSPTGIPSDPVLTAHGLRQSDELAEKLVSINPPIDQIFCSPYYRCLQTIAPAARRLFAKGGKVRVENGFSEFYGNAHFAHPSPAPLSELAEDHFPTLLDESYAPVLIPDVYGETIADLHERLAYVMHRVISNCDADPAGPRTILICTHAAVIIALGRILTGDMPEDPATDDFQCYTASLSRYRRKTPYTPTEAEEEAVGVWQEDKPREVPRLGWRGAGVKGGWTGELNADCSFLSGGEERGWKFFGDESFLYNPNAFNDGRLLEVGTDKKDDGKGSML